MAADTMGDMEAMVLRSTKGSGRGLTAEPRVHPKRDYL